MWYLLLTLVTTWPLAATVTTHLPNDLGDPLLNCWILAWTADHLLALATGHVEAWSSLWHGNIFHPEPYTLGYSEVLIAQSIQVLPIWALTRNIVLGYNLVFLATFVLSGIGMFLLVRQLLDDWRVAFVAGLLFAFIPYRAHQASHIQVMSSQWMPFALYGFERAIATRRLKPLALGSLALVAQNLSCGYFLVFFSFFVPPYVAAALARHGRLMDFRLWLRFAVAGALVGAATVPWMQPYLALRDVHDMRRSLDELAAFSADTWSWFMPEPGTTIWSRWLAPMARPEGALFPGALPVILALIAVGKGASRLAARVRSSSDMASARPWHRALIVVGLGLTAWGLITLGVLLVGEGGLYRVAGVRLRIQSVSRSLEFIGIGLLVLCGWSRSFRQHVLATLRSPLVFSAAATGLAIYLSLGPEPRAGGKELNGPPLYWWLYEFVPGMDGLRVPARFAAVGGLFLVVTAGFGLRDVARWLPHRAASVLAAISCVWLVESATLPFPVAMHGAADTPVLRDPPTHLPVGWSVPPEAQALSNLPANAVLVHLPMGDISWELHYMYDSIYHWRPMVNGYSGYAPRTYLDLVDPLRDPTRSPERAWQRLMASTATHAVVHRSAFKGQSPPWPYAWLESHGAEIQTTVGDVDVYRLPR